jgi:phosphatidylglycerophosphatase A
LIAGHTGKLIPFTILSDSTQPIRLPAESKPAGRGRSPQGLRDYLSLVVATCGVGYIKLAPGTWGSGVGVLIYLLWRKAAPRLFVFSYQHGEGAGAVVSQQTAIGLVLLLVITLIGIAAASRAAELMGRKDPGQVVIDEVAGQLITLSILPAVAGWKGILAGFLLFRLFDIWKPYPIRSLEILPGGMGIVLDDVAAGFYGLITLSVLMTVRLMF